HQQSKTGVVKVLYFDRRKDRFTWSKWQARIGNRVEKHFYRNTLNHLHIVPSGIVLRQKAERSAATHLDTVDMTLECFTPERIHFDFHRLARPHQPKLIFLKVRRHPDVRRNQSKQVLTDLDVVTQFD